MFVPHVQPIPIWKTCSGFFERNFCFGVLRANGKYYCREFFDLDSKILFFCTDLLVRTAFAPWWVQKREKAKQKKTMQAIF